MKDKESEEQEEKKEKYKLNTAEWIVVIFILFVGFLAFIDEKRSFNNKSAETKQNNNVIILNQTEIPSLLQGD